ncbi:uncharacterized protein LOC132174255 [Corylus avellana]|uniref:uncharacterized protein LOC132174255 n=1 Tax=Corylus avellana TaxID=13451 RepID=UPI00286AF13B|nr:uncharacterized protein LOC132174255 [Corylus avellana]
MIKQRLAVAQSRQKSYPNVRRRELGFEVGTKVFLKVTPMKGVMRFGRRGKLGPKFVGPFEILEKNGTVAYRLALPPNLTRIHNIQSNMTYEETPTRILDRREQVLRSKTISLVKVLWSNHSMEEASWELEESMREKYPYLFE